MSLIPRTTTRGKIVYWICNRWAGKQVWKKIGTDKRFAQREDERMKREIKAGTYQPDRQKRATTFRQWAEEWCKKRDNRSAHDDVQRIRDHVLTRPWLADMPLQDLAPRHMMQLIDELKRTPLASTGKPPAAKTVWNIYGVVRTCIRDARIAELIDRDPCVLPRGTVKQGVTKRRVPYEGQDVLKLIGFDVREQRARVAQVSRSAPAGGKAEPEQRTSSPEDAVTNGAVPSPVPTSVAPDARVWNALAFLTGCREGEVCGLLWRDWDRTPKPLGCLVVERQYDGQPLKTSASGDEKPRRVPVHPLLAILLDWWWRKGFLFVYHRLPTLSDPIVPKRAERYRGGRRKAGPNHTGSTAYHMWRAGLEAAGVVNRSLHSTRHTFVSLARRGGARKDVLERITHNSSGDIVDAYTHWDWAPLCEAVMCLEVSWDRTELRRQPLQVFAGQPGGNGSSSGYSGNASSVEHVVDGFDGAPRGGAVSWRCGTAPSGPAATNPLNILLAKKLIDSDTERKSVMISTAYGPIEVGEAGFEPDRLDHDPLDLTGLIRGESWI